jgi:hypothetical protein
VDGGEWLDFVSSDLKSLTPRPQHQPRREREASVEAGRLEPAAAEVIQHPAVTASPVLAPEPVYAMAEAEEAIIAAAPPLEPEPEYEPDQERRDKFLSRFSRWAKK